MSIPVQPEGPPAAGGPPPEPDTGSTLLPADLAHPADPSGPDDPGPHASDPAPTDWSLLEDRELLAAHVAGREGAFGELFARHRDRLWAVALRTTGHPEDAADGLQDAMVAAYRRAGSYRGDAAVTTWLHRVVVNACLDRLRAAKVRRAQPLPDDLDDHPAAVLPTDGHGQPEASSVRAEERRAVLRALATLPADQRAAIVLVDMEGYPVAEAALVLDCPVGTVKSRCSRGRARLATLLRPLLEEDGAGEQGHAVPRNPGEAPRVGSSEARAPPGP